MQKTFLTILIVLFEITNAYCEQRKEGQAHIDSLYGIWNDESLADTRRAQALNKLIWDGYLYSNPDSAYYLAEVLRNFALDANNERFQAEALLIQGKSTGMRGDLVTSEKLLNKSLVLFQKIENDRGTAKAIFNLGNVAFYGDEESQALSLFNQCLDLFRFSKDSVGIGRALESIGLVYKNNGNYNLALNYFLRAQEINEESNYKDKHYDYYAIGDIYAALNNFPRATEYYAIALESAEASNNMFMVSQILEGIGHVYQQEGEYSKALENLERGLSIANEANHPYNQSLILMNIGSIYFEMGDYKSALIQFEAGHKISKEYNQDLNSHLFYLQKGKTKLKQEKYADAFLACANALELSEMKADLEGQYEAAICLYETQKALEQPIEAMIYFEKAFILKDSLNKNETSKKLQQMEFAKQVVADSLKQEAKNLEVQIAYEAEVRKKNKTKNIAIASGLFILLIAVGLWSRLKYVRKTKVAIEKEKDRSENLLLNILPAEIAVELKEKGRADARGFDKVSILFTDFKDFTLISGRLNAQELVSEINACFETFDAICGKYSVEKIKTIGDAYMAAGGMPVPTDDSIKNTVLAALEMQAFISNRKTKMDTKGKPAFEMRVGIHTGPVVAGIVGMKKFQYDIWGDTVNSASRMESNGEVGKVNISQSTYELLKDEPQFVFESRGKIEVKGKGEMEMWFVSLKTEKE